jgi:hypothetical protein
MHRIRTLSAAVALVAGTLAPLQLQAPGAEPIVVRLSAACGQATECVRSPEYICSTRNGDHVGYACSKGCNAQL